MQDGVLFSDSSAKIKNRVKGFAAENMKRKHNWMNGQRAHIHNNAPVTNIYYTLYNL